MVIKKYVVNNMNEAMSKIRHELGKEAVIVSQRYVKRPGIKGFFGKKNIEVTAAIENTNTKLDSIELFKNSFKTQENFEHKNNLNVQEILDIKNNNEQVEKINYEQKLTRQMEEMRDLITKITIDNKGIETKENKLKTILKKSDVEDSLIEKIIDSLDDKESLDELKGKIAEMLTLNNDPISGNVVLVGPTGVGKTTTIAKLAGSLALIDKKKVGLITVDTYRIGAVEQLKTYAEIMNIPFEVVYTIKEMEKTIEKMASCDVILIDTTGRNGKNFMQISELRAFLNKVNSEDINLVVSSTTKNNDLKTIIDGYEVLNYKNIIITKLDETVSYGSILNISSISKRPIRFLTVGQNVPDDIKKFSKEKLIDLILGESSIC